MKAKASVYFGAIALFVIFGLALSCSKAPNDTQIVSDIQSKLAADSGLQGKQLSVQAASGTVTLAGTVDSDAQREAAARYAASEEGVKQVINNLQVGAPTRAAAVVAPRVEPKPKPSPEPKKRRERKDKDQDQAGPMDQPSQPVAQMQPPAPASTPAVQQTPTPPPPPPPQKVTIPSGTALSVRLVDSIDSERNQTGDSFHATLNSPITINGDTVIPSGTDVVGHLVDVKSAGKFAGQSVVALQLDNVTSAGKTYNIQTDQYKKQGSSRGKNTAEKVGAGAGIGAIIGALAGGGKGAAIGAAAGGGLGGGVQAATKGQQIKLPSETILNFTLQAPLTVVASNQGPDSGRQKLGPNN
jgi:hypothetical protein